MPEIEIIYFIILSIAIIVTAMIRSNDIVNITLYNTAFSLFTVILYLVLDAPDVAMTEASVGLLSIIFAVFAIKSAYPISYKFIDKFKPLYLVLTMGLAGVLIYAAEDLPSFGAPRFDRYYLLNSENDTGITSVVASILASYRGYDTMLETLVILVGALSVLLITDKAKFLPVKQDKLIKVMVRVMMPMILLFALYIQFHGEISPGGGFQAGAIIATMFAAYALAYGEKALLSLISERKLVMIAVSGLGLYLLVGLLGIMNDSNFLNYNMYFTHSLWVMIVEFGIAIAVACSMLLIYIRLAYVSSQSV